MSEYILNNELEPQEFQFPNINHTYFNGEYLSTIDHCLTNKIASEMIVTCLIVESESNTGDHHAIIINYIVLDKQNNNLGEKNLNKKKFYKFNWKNDDFKSQYKQALGSEIERISYNLEQELSYEQKNEYVESKIDQIRESMIKAARKADNFKKSEQLKINRVEWTEELKEMHKKCTY